MREGPARSPTRPTWRPGLKADPDWWKDLGAGGCPQKLLEFCLGLWGWGGAVPGVRTRPLHGPGVGAGTALEDKILFTATAGPGAGERRETWSSVGWGVLTERGHFFP